MPHFPFVRPVSRLHLIMIFMVFYLALPGCIRKRMTVRSNPPGAMAYIDKQPIGLTPVSTSFTYYGTRNFELVRDGYRPERFLRKISPPWYAIPPLDFFSESLWPFEKRDERIIDVQLTPAPVVSAEALIEGGEQLRLQSSQGIASSAPPTLTTPVPIVSQPTTPSAFGQPSSGVPILGPTPYQ
jgi:hypothetical protein